MIMPSHKMVLRTVLMTFIFLSYGEAQSSMCNTEEKAVTKIINSLGFRLQQMVDIQENYFFSPLSISVALAMVYVGARGTTREEMSEALEYNVVGKNCLPNKIQENFRELIRSLHREGDDYSFLIANGAFIQNGFPISHFYSSKLQKFFNTNIKFLNFEEEEVISMNKINEWVSNSTNGKIKNLLNEPLNIFTRMVLLNAVYFKGLWNIPFDENATRTDIFYGFNNANKSVPFMEMQNKAYHYHDTENKFSVLEMDYLGGKISIVFILPDDVNAIPNYELTGKFLCDLRNKLDHKFMKIVIPKFSMEFKRELSKDMTKLGMFELFSDKPDLTGIREANDLLVSLMVHKAIIEVNEKGSEASSILAVGIDGRRQAARQEMFVANHPFLFYVIHKESNTVLFSGRLVDP